MQMKAANFLSFNSSRIRNNRGGFYGVERNRIKLFGKRLELTFDLYWNWGRRTAPLIPALLYCSCGKFGRSSSRTLFKRSNEEIILQHARPPCKTFVNIAKKWGPTLSDASRHRCGKTNEILDVLLGFGSIKRFGIGMSNSLSGSAFSRSLNLTYTL